MEDSVTWQDCMVYARTKMTYDVLTAIYNMWAGSKGFDILKKNSVSRYCTGGASYPDGPPSFFKQFLVDTFKLRVSPP